MSIIGYPNRLRPARLAEQVIDVALGIAGVLLNADKPLPRDDDRLARIAADVAAIRQFLTSAAPVCPIPPGTEDAAETPRAEPAARPGQLRVEDIPGWWGMPGILDVERIQRLLK